MCPLRVFCFECREIVSIANVKARWPRIKKHLLATSVYCRTGIFRVQECVKIDGQPKNKKKCDPFQVIKELCCAICNRQREYT